MTKENRAMAVAVAASEAANEYLAAVPSEVDVATVAAQLKVVDVELLKAAQNAYDEVVKVVSDAGGFDTEKVEQEDYNAALAARVTQMRSTSHAPTRVLRWRQYHGDLYSYCTSDVELTALQSKQRLREVAQRPDAPWPTPQAPLVFEWCALPSVHVAPLAPPVGDGYHSAHAGIERLTSIMAEARSAMHSHDVDATIEGINNLIDGLSALEEEYQRGGAGSAQYYVVFARIAEAICCHTCYPSDDGTYDPGIARHVYQVNVVMQIFARARASGATPRALVDQEYDAFCTRWQVADCPEDFSWQFDDTNFCAADYVEGPSIKGKLEHLCTNLYDVLHNQPPRYNKMFVTVEHRPSPHEGARDGTDGTYDGAGSTADGTSTEGGAVAGGNSQSMVSRGIPGGARESTDDGAVARATSGNGSSGDGTLGSVSNDGDGRSTLHGARDSTLSDIQHRARAQLSARTYKQKIERVLHTWPFRKHKGTDALNRGAFLHCVKIVVHRDAEYASVRELVEVVNTYVLPYVRFMRGALGDITGEALDREVYSVALEFCIGEYKQQVRTIFSGFTGRRRVSNTYKAGEFTDSAYRWWRNYLRRNEGLTHDNDFVATMHDVTIRNAQELAHGRSTEWRHKQYYTRNKEKAAARGQRRAEEQVNSGMATSMLAHVSESTYKTILDERMGLHGKQRKRKTIARTQHATISKYPPAKRAFGMVLQQINSLGVGSDLGLRVICKRKATRQAPVCVLSKEEASVQHNALERASGVVHSRVAMLQAMLLRAHHMGELAISLDYFGTDASKARDLKQSPKVVVPAHDGQRHQERGRTGKFSPPTATGDAPRSREASARSTEGDGSWICVGTFELEVCEWLDGYPVASVDCGNRGFWLVDPKHKLFKHGQSRAMPAGTWRGGEKLGMLMWETLAREISGNGLHTLYFRTYGTMINIKMPTRLITGVSYYHKSIGNDMFG